MRGSILMVVGGVAFALSLACGGEWDAALAQQMGEELNAGTGLVMGCAESPEKDRVLAALGTAKSSIANIGLVEGANLRVMVDQAASDNVIDAAEADAIEASVREVTASK